MPIDWNSINDALRQQAAVANAGQRDVYGQANSENAQRRIGQVEQLRQSLADPTWGQQWNSWATAQRDASFRDITNADGQQRGAMATRLADRGLLGSGVAAQATGIQDAATANARTQTATQIVGQQDTAERARDGDARSLLDKVLAADPQTTQQWEGSLAAYRNGTATDAALRQNDAQYRGALSDALGGVFRAGGDYVSAGFQNASLQNTATPAANKSWFNYSWGK
jgi:hypothetical protein